MASPKMTLLQAKTRELMEKKSADISLLLKQMPDCADELWKLVDDYDRLAIQYIESDGDWYSSLASICWQKIFDFFDDNAVIDTFA